MTTTQAPTGSHAPPVSSVTRMESETTGHRRLLALAGIWLSFALALGFWWNRLAFQLAVRVAELEAQYGAPSAGHLSESRLQRMLNLESGAFLALFAALSVVLLFFHWRFVRRTQGLQRFFAGVTHELRTPLTSIRLQAESIASHASPETRELSRRLLEDCLRLESQVDRTLDLARVESGGTAHFTPLDLKRVIERTVQPWRDTLAPERFRVTLDPSLTGLQVEADPTLLRTVFRNLVDNSIRHVPPPEACEIIISRAPDAGGDSGRVRVIYRDSGSVVPRFPPGTRPGEIFARGSASQGTGVGLYLIHTLMRKMGGSAEVKLEPGFPVTLDFKQAKDLDEGDGIANDHGGVA